MLGAVLLIVLAGFAHGTLGACRHSEFYRYFKDLGTAETKINPVERVVFSMLLTATEPQAQTPRFQQVP